MITTAGGHGDLRMLSEIPRNPAQLSLRKKSGDMIADSADEVRMRVRVQLLQGCIADQACRRRRLFAAQSAGHVHIQ